MMNLSNLAENAALDVNIQNGIEKRMNRTIQERVVSMLQHFGLSDGF